MVDEGSVRFRCMHRPQLNHDFGRVGSPLLPRHVARIGGILPDRTLIINESPTSASKDQARESLRDADAREPFAKMY